MVRVMTEVQAFKYGELGTCAAPQETLEQLNELVARDRLAQAQARKGREQERAAQAHVRTAQAQAWRAYQRVQQDQQEAALLHQFHTQNLEAQPRPWWEMQAHVRRDVAVPPQLLRPT
jgi:hypothetical protein